MNNPTREEIILLLKPLFKKEGFSKIGSTWYKSTDDLICIFNIQGSLYSSEYYINVGVYLKALGNEERPPEYHCHLTSRIDETKSCQEIFYKAMEWFDVHNSIEKLKDLNNRKQLPLTTMVIAKEYLSNS